MRDWLAEKGMSEADLGAWELALVEAANNAVKYTGPEAPPSAGRHRNASWGDREVEAQLTDHTAGFDWPDDPALPNVDSERGRGLFLIKSLTDNVVYLRHPGHNVLVLRRARPGN